MKLPALFKKKELGVSSPIGGGGYYPLFVNEPFTGAWQRNLEWRRDSVASYHAVFACITLIASDISKMRLKNMRKDSDDIWVEIPMGDYKVLNKPNPYQNRMQFMESWMLSKLFRGNTYALKTRDSRNNVIRLDILHPDMVLPLVSPDGQVFYQLSQDNLAGVSEVGITVPASEIIHDRYNCIFHPLVGLSAIFACGLPAYQGLKIQENSARHFKNGSRPSGILTAPGAISPEDAQRLKEGWESSYGGDNYGKTAVLGDDLKYVPITMTAVDSQMVEQLRLSAEMVCSTFHVPRYKVIGEMPSFNNVEAFEQQYFSQCLQVLIEAIELCLDEGLGVQEDTGFEFDLDGLLRMDTKTQVETLGAGVNKAIYSPNEARAKLNMKPVPGGESPMIQQQNFSLEALSKRDAKEDPFSTTSQSTEPDNTDNNMQEDVSKFFDIMEKRLSEVTL